MIIKYVANNICGHKSKAAERRRGGRMNDDTHAYFDMSHVKRKIL